MFLLVLLAQLWCGQCWLPFSPSHLLCHSSGHLLLIAKGMDGYTGKMSEFYEMQT